MIHCKAFSTDGWVYGHYIEVSHGANTHGWIFTKPGAQISVDPKTRCQFTGLTDLDGVKIYADDIREDKEGKKVRIYHVPGGFVIKASYWAESLGDFHFTDKLISEALSEPQVSNWLINNTTHVRNIHDIQEN